jgi:hypothetical protein
MRRGDGASLAVLGGLAWLVHPEAVLVWPAYAGVRLVRQRDRTTLQRQTLRRLLPGAIALVGIVLVATLARWLYFGDLVPNTFHAKPGGLDRAIFGGYQWLIGRNANVSFPLVGWMALPLLALGYAEARRRLTNTSRELTANSRELTAPGSAASSAAADMLLAVTATGLLFAIYSPPDWTMMGRYFGPYLPAALMLTWLGVLRVARALWPRRSQRTTRAVACGAVALALAVVSLHGTKLGLARLDRYPGYVMASRTLIGPARWMAEHLDEGSTIATRRIGALAYYGGHPIFDYVYGLPDREVARRVGRRGRRINLPTEADIADLWRRRRPDYLLEDADIMQQIIAQSGGGPERFELHGVAYRLWRRFPIGPDQHWVLAERLGGRAKKPEVTAGK